MGIRLRIFVVACVCAFAASGAFGLDLREGRIKIVLNEQTARFSLYYLDDIAKNTYTPLLYDQEPRTTFPSLSVDGKVFRLGEAADYRFVVQKTPTGAMVEYRSSFCVVRQTFGFVTSQGGTMVDGVSIGFELENVSEKDQAIGLRFLLDTFLGEKNGRHFSLGAREKLANETVLAGQFEERKAVSPGDSAVSLAVMVTGDGVTRPDKVVLANWKRLYDAAWSFDSLPSRDFNLYPYSINDSAIALYFEPVKLRKGASRSIVVAFGADSEKGFSLPGAQPVQPETAITTGVLSQPLPQDPLVGVQTDLIAVRTLLDALNAKLGTGAQLTSEELAQYRAIIEQLEKRKASYR